VIVPFATFIDGNDKLVTERFVIVAEVNVAFVPFKLSVLILFPAIFCPVKLVTVVEAKVDEAETIKF
jgi:hypothetical protein